MSAPAHTVQRSKLNPIEYLIQHFLSNRGKRILFVTSLYFRIFRFDALKEEAIAKLNALMQLSSHDSGMHLPALLHSFIWRRIPIDQILKPETILEEVPDVEALRISKEVVQCAPRCVHYGSEEEMLEDVYKLISNGNHLSATETI